MDPVTPKSYCRVHLHKGKKNAQNIFTEIQFEGIMKSPMTGETCMDLCRGLCCSCFWILQGLGEFQRR